MRVLYATSWLSDRGGGIPPVIWGFSREMSKLGVDSVVAGLSDDPTREEKQVNGATIIAGRGANAFGYSPELRSKVLSHLKTVSLVHTHGLWMHPGVVAREVAAAAAVPLVISAHGMLESWALGRSAWKKRIAGWLFENKNLRAAACLHALCEAEAQNYRDYGLSNPICIIPNGIDLPEIGDPRSEIRNQRLESGEHSPTQSCGKPGKVDSGKPPWEGLVQPGQRVLLYLGRIHPKKGLANLIEAWAALEKNRNSEIGNQESKWVLAIAGWDQGGHEAELKRLCIELQVPFADATELNSKIRNQKSPISVSGFQLSAFPSSLLFLGPQFNRAKATCYHHCDGFILPSFSEGLPIAVLEAWANSKPVLMTPQCNLPEGFAAGAAMRIENNVKSIADQLRVFHAMSESARQQMGQTGRDLVGRRFNWRNVGGEMFQVYQWLLGNRAKPECVRM